VLEGELQLTKPKRLRGRLLHVAGRIFQGVTHTALGAHTMLLDEISSACAADREVPIPMVTNAVGGSRGATEQFAQQREALPSRELAGPVAVGRRVSFGEMGFRVEGIDHVALAVGDHRGSERWYREVLGLTREFVEEWGDTPAVLMAGGSGFALFKAPPGDTGALVRHVALRVDRANFEAAQEDFRTRGISFEFQDHGAAHSIYFEDPDGLRLELTTYDV
jgi:catechol 2,3-dioxygenase-like lactoylglutathione lyase family enzyme